MSGLEDGWMGTYTASKLQCRSAGGEIIRHASDAVADPKA